MAKHRKMIYHHAGSPRLTVETISTTELDGEEYTKNTNVQLESKTVMDLVKALEDAVDAEIGLAGDDPVTAASFVVEEVPPVDDN